MDHTDQLPVQPRSRFLHHSQVEILNEISFNQPPEHILFDFDGTLSLIREGWAAVMIPMMVEIIRETGTSESKDEISQMVEEFVQELNGKQTIYQMIRLVEEVRKRGGEPKEPQFYKDLYHQQLMKMIGTRREGLRDKKTSRSEHMVPYAGEFLDELQKRGLKLYLASGTDQNYVKEEASLLGLDNYFGEQIYGAVDDYRSFSKQLVIEKILRENQIEGSRLIGIGDGFVEIKNIKSAGGIAIAVASDESGRCGKPDPWKRNRLIGVGADIVIPDYRDYPVLLKYIFGS